MRKKSKSRKARRTGSPIGEEDDSEVEVTEEVYEVECVVDHRVRRTGVEYKVRWRGWSPQFDEWLHHTKMDCPDAIQEYWRGLEAVKQAGSSKKREHSDTTDATESRKSVSSPASKRRTPPMMETSHDSGQQQPDGRRLALKEGYQALYDYQRRLSPSVHHFQLPTDFGNRLNLEASDAIEPPSPLSEDVHQPTPKKAKARSSGALSSGTKKNVKSKLSLSETVSESPLLVSGEPSAADSSRRSSTPSAVRCSDNQPRSSSACSSPGPSQIFAGRRALPIPPTIPKRKIVQSDPTATTASQLPTIVENARTGASSPAVHRDGTTSTSSSAPYMVAKEKPFVRPHGFERGLTVERIHGFVRRADILFAVVQFRNCDVVEFLATNIVKRYEPMALIRGFEEHHIRSRRNKILSSPQSSQQMSF